MHVLIVGGRGVGKSTLINNIVNELQLPLWGFRTKKEDSLAVDRLGSPVYIYDVNSSPTKSPENLLGYCACKNINIYPKAFVQYSRRLQETVPKGHLVLMDELGTMESSSPSFCNSVLSLLDTAPLVIAAVKDKDTDFLNKVREHPNCRCFYITKENRDSLLKEVLQFMLSEVKLYYRKH